MAGRANQVDGFVTAFGFHLSHHSPDVILYRKFRQIQAGGNFLVREALRDQIHQLKLAVRQAVLVRSYIRWGSWVSIGIRLRHVESTSSTGEEDMTLHRGRRL